MTRHRERWERFKLHGDQTAREELIKEFVALVHYVVGLMGAAAILSLLWET